jgi:hypothetical protein
MLRTDQREPCTGARAMCSTGNIMDDDRLKTALREPESERGSVERPVPQHARASPIEPNTALDPRHRRGSFGPVPKAAPLDDSASSAALHAHLARLLEASRTAPPPAQITGADAEQMLGAHEDLERQPDGIPHLVIGLTALFSVALAAVVIGMFRSGPTLGSIASVVIAIVAIPVLVFRLGAKAERERDHEHPSR